MKGIGPGPYTGMLLADMGAEVICIERARSTTGIGYPAQYDIHCRGKKSVAINLKSAEGVATLLSMIEQSDMLIEGFRLGVMEKLGLSPQICHQRNPKLVYGRIPAGGKRGLCRKLQGMLAALHVATLSGKRDVVDAAITDGSASLMSILHTAHSLKGWAPQRQSNLLDGGAYFYRCYETADGKHVSIGPIEPPFHAILLEKAGIDPDAFADQMNPTTWQNKGEILSKIFKSKTRDQWCEILEGSDACFAPVLDFTEAPLHPHNQARDTYIDINGVTQSAPAPRFSHHQAAMPKASVAEDSDTEEVLADFGFDQAEIKNLREFGALP